LNNAGKSDIIEFVEQCMNEAAMIDTRQIHPMRDFLRNHKAHVARIKETRTPEVLTINGRAELVMLDTQSHESIMERLEDKEAISAIRAIIRTANDAAPRAEVSEAEIERSQAVVKELMAETERRKLYLH
jgi:hypothetical protein